MKQGIRKPAFDPRHGRRAMQAAAGAIALLALHAQALNRVPLAPLPSSATLAPRANPLPRPAANFNLLGRASQSVDARNPKSMVIQQTDPRVILNWSSFDIGPGYSVRFNQPAGGSALNRVGGSDPSVILGKLDANAEVILYNSNGVLFGKGATVNSGNFIATTLNIADEQFARGFRNITSYTPAFQAPEAIYEGFVRVEKGASIAAARGGDILLFAPRVLNEGRLAAPGGQVALAAGEKVYLAASFDPSARGLLVEVDPFTTSYRELNTVENAARGSTEFADAGKLVQRVNEIVAERGNVSLVALAVKQTGTARASTAVKGQNGAIYLLAHGPTEATRHSDGIDGHQMAAATELGELILGPQSSTRVDVDASGGTQLDAEPFYNSVVRLEGRQVHLQGGARIVAPGAGGVTPAADALYQEARRGVSILASATPLSSGAFGTSTGANDDSRIVIDPGVQIDVAGTHANLSMSSNVISGRLFSIQLADTPLQRSGVLYRKEVSFDRRDNGGKGLKVANVLDFYNQIRRGAEERLAGGGSIAIKSDGAVVVGQGARLDVSGGALHVAGGELKTTQLRSGNRLVAIAAASPDVLYDEVIAPATGRYEAAYVEGRNAGDITVVARQLVLDAQLAGGRVAGRYQRGGSAGAQPLAGRLQLGVALGPPSAADYYLNSLVLGPAAAKPLAGSFFKDPFYAALGARGETTTVAAQAIEDGGFGRLELLANKSLKLASGTDLTLAPGGSFSASAGRIEVDGTLSVAAGSISLRTVPTVSTTATPAAGVASVVFGARSGLSTAGWWTNDGDGAARNAEATVATGGGSIKVGAYDSVLLPAGAALDVSAGAWRNGAGKLSYGKAGFIELTANAGNGDPLFQVGKVQLDGQVQGYGFASGGYTADPANANASLGLTLSSLDLTVAATKPPAGTPTAGTGATAPGALTLTPEFFSDNGFKDIRLSSIRDLKIADGTRIEAQLRSRVLNRDADEQPSGKTVAAVTHFADAVEVDAVARRAVDLRFAATRLPADQLNPDLKKRIAGASLSIGSGATIATEAGGRLAFSAGANLTVAGTLAAPGGEIALSIDGTRGGQSSDTGDKIGFLARQALWLTSTARLLAAGTAEYEADPRNGQRSGQVYGGGKVTLKAGRGYVLAQAGSEIDIGGHEATLDLFGGRVSSVISRDAGTLAISSPEGILVDSTIRAVAPGPRAQGGSLKLSLSREGFANFTEGAAYSTAPRKIVLRQGGAGLPKMLKPGDDVFAAIGNGTAAVSAQALNSSGFATLQLRADDRIEFAQDVSIAAARSLELNSRVIAGLGKTAASLAAPRVALGNPDILPILDMAAPSATSGSASLAVTADLIDVVGTLGLQGFKTVALKATGTAAGVPRRDGEIRLYGRTLPGSTAQTGALLFAGGLDLTAGQIYPTTLTDFSITGLAGDSTLRSLAPAGGSSSAAPLSAFGKLSLSADTIKHGGVIRAPQGNLDLNAVNSLSLAAGSELSVSGAGLSVPVGTTVNGTTWYYYPLGSASAEVRSLAEVPVTKQVSLKAATLALAPTARVSAAGGGDALASEFIPGAGGTRDYFALADSRGLYAVLPQYAFGYAPVDAQVAAAGSPKPGEQIVITMAGSGLAPGRYTLLPAAYALLPGAFLVSKAAVQGDTILPAALAQADGSHIVTAYRSVSGSAIAGDAHQRYLVEPAATFRSKSEYRLTRASDLFTGQAQRLGTSRGSLPVDAGRISLAATQLPEWRAQFDLAAPRGARGGEFDLAVPRLAVVAAGQAAPAGYTAVSSESLAATGAASVLLGGRRSGSGAAVTIETISEHVRVESGGASSGELLLAASSGIEVAAGARLGATGKAETTPGQLKLAGDGAFLRVSNRQGVDIVRSGANGAPLPRAAGDLELGANASLVGAQVDVDATHRMTLNSSATLKGDAIGLGAGRIAFAGTAPAESDSVLIDGSLLAALRGASSLNLRSYSSIDFLGSLDLVLVGKGRLLLDAPALRGLGQPGDSMKLAASEVLLRNTSGNTLAAGGQGRLSIEARPPLRDRRSGGMEIGGGLMSLGFSKITLASKGDLILSGTGRLATQGDLDFVAARLTAASAADQALVAGGVLSVSRPADGRSLGERIGLGARLALSGQRVLQKGSIELPGGQLKIAAENAAGHENGIEFGAGSVTRAGGFSVDAQDGWQLFGDAGSIEASSARGAIRVDGTLGVAALSGGGSAGRMGFAATGTQGRLTLGSTARLEAAAGKDGTGGSFAADLEGLTGSIDRLATAATDFTHEFDLRVRHGDVRLDSTRLKAQTVALAADAGDIGIGGSIDASGRTGGRIDLYARRDAEAGGHISLEAGSLLKANATDKEGPGNTGRGGSVTLGVSASSAAGELQTGIAVQAAANGKAAASIDVSAVPPPVEAPLPPPVTLPGVAADDTPPKVVPKPAPRSAPNGSVVFRLPRQDTEQPLLTLAGAALGSAATLSVNNSTFAANTFSIATPMSAYQPGMVAVFSATANSTGALKLNVNGKGAVPLVQADGSPFSSTARISSGQVVAAVYDGKQFVLSSTGLADTGTLGSAYKVAFTAKPAALATGMLVSFRAKNPNPAGTVTLAVNADAKLTANLVDENGAALAANAIKADQLVTAVYDGGKFRVLRDPSLAATPNITASILAGTLAVNGSIVGADSSSVDAVRSIARNHATAVAIGADTQRAWLAQNKSAAALIGAPAGLLYRPGLEVVSNRDLIVAGDWNFSGARYNGEPGSLSLRAAGNLSLDGTISDGFNGVARNSAIQAGKAWSLNFAAGADLAAANPLAVNGTASGDLLIAGGKLLRTTTGSIDMAAGRDIVLGGSSAAPATVMVTGAPSPLDPVLAAEFTTPANAIFTSRGGRLRARAGRDIKAPASDQVLVNNWFQRSGRLNTAGEFATSSMAWWSRFDLFRHGFGSFGGGNVAISAGGNIQDISVAAPTSARMGSLLPDETKLVIENGGDIEVAADGDIAGGSFFIGRGKGSLRADGKIDAGVPLNSTVGALAPVLALMDGAWQVRARGDANLAAVFNPTIVVPNRNTTGSSFYSYGKDASLDVASTAGNFNWRDISNAALGSLSAAPTGTTEDLAGFVSSTFPTPYVAPPRVRIAAYSGSVTMDGNSGSPVGISLFPSATGSFELYAGRDLALNTSIRMMDNLPESLASVTAPSGAATTNAFLGLDNAPSYDLKSANNKLVFTNLHAADNDPVRIHAEGSLAMVDGKKFITPKQATISAGLDIGNLTFYGQHHGSQNLTLISAGRNFVNTTTTANNGLVSLAGPGLLEIRAGRQLKLGASAGIETSGNIYNATLPDTGASVRLAAGLDATLDAAGLDKFLATYLAASGAPSGASYRKDLVDYVTTELKPGSAYSFDRALALFGDFSAAGQIGFVKSVLAREFGRSYLASGKAYASAWAQAAATAGVSPTTYAGRAFERMRDQVMFEELKQGGTAGSGAKDAAAKDAGYARGYAAIDLAGYGAPFRFMGDIDLIQSKVQTHSGGDIEFRAPGGGVNVGLSVDVSSTNATDTPEQKAAKAAKRGVVAYAGGNIRSFSDGDFLVNAQKVFVIGAGDILLWSSNGNIDSGKGSNNTVTVPPLVAREDPITHEINFVLPPLATGSGIGILDASNGKADGAAYLFAPRGEIIALDAFIRAPRITFDPDKIRGADNVIGVAANPVSAPAVASVGALGSVASTPTETASSGGAAPRTAEREKSSILTVEVLAIGDAAPALPAAAGPAIEPQPGGANSADDPASPDGKLGKKPKKGASDETATTDAQPEKQASRAGS